MHNILSLIYCFSWHIDTPKRGHWDTGVHGLAGLGKKQYCCIIGIGSTVFLIPCCFQVAQKSKTKYPSSFECLHPACACYSFLVAHGRAAANCHNRPTRSDTNHLSSQRTVQTGRARTLTAREHHTCTQRHAGTHVVLSSKVQAKRKHAYMHDYVWTVHACLYLTDALVPSDQLPSPTFGKVTACWLRPEKRRGCPVHTVQGWNRTPVTEPHPRVCYGPVLAIHVS